MSARRGRFAASLLLRWDGYCEKDNQEGCEEVGKEERRRRAGLLAGLQARAWDYGRSKGSCEPKAKQTKGEKKADSKAAAASKREKGQG